MIIRGHFIGDAPYLGVHLQFQEYIGKVWFLIDTGAAKTTLLDRDLMNLRISMKKLYPAEIPIIGIGGSVRSFILHDVKIMFASDIGVFSLQQDVWIAMHDINLLPPDEASRILRLPSVLGRDIINKFHFCCDYRTGTIQLVGVP